MEMSKRMRGVVILLIVMLVGTIAFDVIKQAVIAHFMKNFKMPPETVETVLAKSVTWSPKLDAIGTLKAVHGVDVSSEVPGQIVSIHFKSGDQVISGQSLIQLDDSSDLAQLHNDQAALILAQTEYARQKMLIKQGATSKQSLDQAKAKLNQELASVNGDEIAVSKKNIGAPFAGKIGIRQVDLGQYVTAGQALVTLQTMDPLLVDFYLPEQNLKDIYVNQSVLIDISAYPNQEFQGKITAIDSTVDPTTRNFQVRAEVPNPQGKLYPGVFANVSVILPEQQHVVVIPQTAISYTLYGDSVYIIKKMGLDKNKKPVLQVHRLSVVLGEQRSNLVTVKAGLKAGDEIVNAGQVKLQEGTQVVINNAFSLGK